MKKTIRFTPPDYIWIFVILGIVLHYLLPIKQIIFTPYTYLGIPLIVLGAYLNFVWVYITFRKEKITFNPYEFPKKLITYGAFRISRNPTYLGMALALVGIAILLGSVVTFIFPIIFIILTDKLVIPIEEKNLKKKFGKGYLEYKKKVRKWI